MLKNKLKDQKGFTIIEIMIVLAIAGLIMLIVFLAVPALQRSARNTQRKNDVGNVATAISDWTSNNNGNVPGVNDTSPATCASDLSNAVSGIKWGYYTSTSLTCKTTPSGTPSADEIWYVPGYQCTNNAPVAGQSQRSYALVYAVESGSGNTEQCLEG